MLDFYAAKWTTVVRNLDKLSNLLNMDILRAAVSGQASKIVEPLEGIESVCRWLDLPFTSNYARKLVEQVREEITKGILKPDEFIRSVNTLRERFDEESESIHFLYIPIPRVVYYYRADILFDESCRAEFPSATKDMTAAFRCYALGQWTACVFHSMRVLEHGLRWFAAKLSIPMSSTADEQWKVIIDGIEKAIRAMEQLPKGQKVDLTFHSEAAVQFRYFKDAWRNHVSHSRESYDEYESRIIMDHVRDFMQHLAGMAQP